MARKRKLGLSREVATGKDCPFGAIRFGCTTRDQRVDISRRRSEIRSALAPLALTYASDARHRHATAAMLGGFTGRHFFTILVLLIDSACASMRPRRFSRGKVTCAADRHTISTEGWPTEAGEISVTFFLGPSNNHQYIIDGRAAGDVQGKTLLLVERQNKKLRLDIVPGQAVTGPILEAGKWYSVKILVRDGRTRVLLDGVEVINVAGTPQFASTATIGNRFEQDESINGPIRSLRIRSYEEVSP